MFLLVIWMIELCSTIFDVLLFLVLSSRASFHLKLSILQNKTLVFQILLRNRFVMTFGKQDDRHSLRLPISVKNAFKKMKTFFFLEKALFHHESLYFPQRSKFSDFFPKNLIMKTEKTFLGNITISPFKTYSGKNLQRSAISKNFKAFFEKTSKKNQ